MKTKKTFYTEAAYVVGLVILVIGTALMEKADFGMSMVVAPAYILHLAVARVLPWFSFGMAEYVFQAVLIALLCLALRTFRATWLFSFLTAVLYGLMLDGVIALMGLMPTPGIALRAVFFFVGLTVSAFGVAMLFNTYLAPEAYDLFVREYAAVKGVDRTKVKTIYDVTSCVVAVAMSFIFFGFGVFKGVNVGTAFTALVNGSLIGLFDRLFKSRLDFRDGLPLRRFFSK